MQGFSALGAVESDVTNAPRPAPLIASTPVEATPREAVLLSSAPRTDGRPGGVFDVRKKSVQVDCTIAILQGEDGEDLYEVDVAGHKPGCWTVAAYAKHATAQYASGLARSWCCMQPTLPLRGARIHPVM